MEYSLLGMYPNLSDKQQGAIDSRMSGVANSKTRAGYLGNIPRNYEGILNTVAQKFGADAAKNIAEGIMNDRFSTQELLKLEQMVGQAGREYDDIKKRESIRSGLLGANPEWFYRR